MKKNANTTLTFHYTGVNKASQKINGDIEARSLALAKVELRRQGIIISKIVKKRSPILKRNSKKVKSSDITVFSRQLATMIESGIPLVQSFDIVAKGQTNTRLKELIEQIKHDVETGLTLSEALKKHPSHFNDLFCNLVDAGEKSGSLDIMLNKIATYKEKIETIKKKIKKALTYPMAVIVVALIVTAGLLIFVVPQFEALFKGFGADLPMMTKTVVELSKFFQSYWYLIFGSLIGIVYAFIYAVKHSSQFAQNVDKTLLKIPVIGPIIEKAAIARFARTLSITFAAGLPLVEALKSVAGATGNIIFSNATNKIRDEVSTGQQMNKAMENTQLFPNMVIQMVAIGEESGALERMLSKVADFYEEDVDNAVDSLSSLLEPIIMTILGVLVGGLVVSMYLPIFKLGAAI
ncbi:type II secretion system F family protein [Legionella longbeachae]|uniref:Pilus assembly protein PilC n=1 Tax=Legionella longbeachae serogroup 1 (strain NSW150) TaxID=661367 RepID=D3HSR8_LEGLN|nr:type II secretion system F family protein [Legionella longbeachae]VEE02451.1 pilus assembly protein PilC [Legionella oakridgensis]HBD7398062.1 type II secretion system F family protein [Legionella pneumophila]ARB91272.1 type II secretion system F family protein [Legionella longbeachae]ARM32303.1 type II secretion system F family protein [Legionella longbeachae]EEZ94904.1 type IV pilus assembly protein PilC [Legionella longbeachae D-4968]